MTREPAGEMPEPAEASGLARIWPPLVGIVGIPVLTFILFYGGTYHGVSDQPIRIATQILTAAPIAAWLIASVFLPGIRVRSPLAIAVAAMLIVLWASVLTSQRPRLSFEAGLTATATGLGLLALLGVMRDAGSRRRLRILIVGVTLFVALGYLVQVLLAWIRWWSFVGSLRVPPLRPSFDSLSLGSPNLIATYLLMVGPLATVILWRSAGRWLAIPAAALFLVGIVLSGSRGGYLGLGVAVVVVVPLLLVANAASTRGVVRRLLSLGSSPRVAFPVIAVIIVGFVAFGPALLARFGAGGEAYRLGFWQTALQLFAAHPLLGTGPDTWPQLQLAVAQDPNLVAVVPHPHNAYVRLLSELGIAGALASIIALATLAWQARSSLRVADRWTRVESVAAIGGLAGVGAQCLVDDLSNLAGVVLLAALLIGWIDSAAPPGVPKARLLRVVPALPAVVAGVLMIAIPSLVRIDDAALTASLGDQAADAGNWSGAADAYRHSLDLDGDLAFYHVDLGLALAHAGDIPGARAEYEAALAEDTLPENMVALATLDALDGDLVAAMSHARDGTARAGNDVNLFVNAGRVAEQAGDAQAATTWYTQAILIDPALAASRVLATDPGVRAASIGAAAEKMALTDPSRAALIAGYGGDGPAAQRYLDLLAPAARDVWAPIVSWLNGDRPAAEAELRRRLSAHPLDFDSAGWLARFLAADGDPSASTYRDWTDALRGDTAPELVYEYSMIPASRIDRALSRWSGYPDAIYMRHGPLDLLPPQAIVVGINRGG